MWVVEERGNETSCCLGGIERGEERTEARRGGIESGEERNVKQGAEEFII